VDPKVALITGANKGIGKEVARQLGAAKVSVVLGIRDARRGAAAEAELSAEGVDCRLARLDVTDATSIANTARRIEADFGRLDFLVNNAGIAVLAEDGHPSAVGLDIFRRTFETNTFGVVAVTNAMLPLLLRAPAGRIINVSSEVGSLTHASDPVHPAFAYNPQYVFNMVAYNSSKTALNALTVAYAKELRYTSVTINSVCPGYVATDINGHSGFLTTTQGAEMVVRALLDETTPHGAFFGPYGPFPW